MLKQGLKVLLIIEQCNPEWASVPLVGYRFYEEISKLVDATLITHERNKAALTKTHPDNEIIYISESQFIKKYYKFAERLSTINGKTIWPLYQTLAYPSYAEFDQRVYKTVKPLILSGKFDIVHSITPMMPRYPVKAGRIRQDIPFILGPVNGGVEFPSGFQEVARQEFAYFNFLRAVGRSIIPGYRATYERADRILAGSTYTLNLVQNLFQIQPNRLLLFYENGISNSFLRKKEEIETKHNNEDIVNLLFVGRLVPYKGADILIEAISKLDRSLQSKIRLTIVGDGSERNALEQQIKSLHLSEQIQLTGWVSQPETLNYYRTADLFCFPSVREFGGAVVLEAMANGLPCIVVNNGGIGEYVTEKTGFRIEPFSREYVVQELTQRIEQLVENQALRQQMSVAAIDRVREFTWDVKAKSIVNLYQEVLQAQQQS